MINRKFFIKKGNLFFKYRSYIPIPIVLLAFYIYYTLPLSELNSIFFNYCLIFSLIGLLIRIIVVGYSFTRTSGRNTKSQVASKLNTTGMYSLIRHPLYLGNFFIWLGISFLTFNVTFILFSIIFYWTIYGAIILAEEKFLLKKFINEYKSYSSVTPLIIPNFMKWRFPVTNFNLKKVIMNEKNGLMGIFTIFYFFNCIDTYKMYGNYYEINSIFYLFLLSVIFYLIIKLFQKINKIYFESST